MSLPGLPPLPKSLSGFELAAANQQLQFNLGTINEQQPAQQQAPPASTQQQQHGISPLTRKSSTLDTQLAVLRREMFGLRQLDLSLLSQLWTLNESIQEFRTMMQDQEMMSPPSPSSQSISDGNSISSGDEGDTPIDVPRMRVAPPPLPTTAPPKRPPITTTNGVTAVATTPTTGVTTAAAVAAGSRAV